MIRIFALQTDGFSPQTGELLCRAADAAHAAAYRGSPDQPWRRQSLAANVLLRYAAARTLGVPMRSVTTASLPTGQPALPGTGLFCSVSHTDKLCICAVADEPVGIDAEKLRDAPMRVAQRVFSPEERAQIAQADDPHAQFFRIWTARESVVKLTGAGLRAISEPVPAAVQTRSFLLSETYIVSVSTFTETS